MQSPFPLATALGFLSLLIVAGCTSKQNSAPPLSPLAEQGRKVYMANCIACHNSDPAKDGAVCVHTNQGEGAQWTDSPSSNAVDVHTGDSESKPHDA